MYLLREAIDIPYEFDLKELSEAKVVAVERHLFTYKSTLEVYKAVDKNLDVVYAFKKPGQDWVDVKVED